MDKAVQRVQNTVTIVLHFSFRRLSGTVEKERQSGCPVPTEHAREILFSYGERLSMVAGCVRLFVA